LDKAARPLAEFIDDFSNWYLRRSRERFKSDDQADRESAIATTRFVLRETAKLIAPFLPFTAERVFTELKIAGDPESVHLADWPAMGEINIEVINYMNQARRLVEVILAKRGEAGIKVRQPVAQVIVKSELPAVYLELIKDEVNAKAIKLEASQLEEVVLDLALTSELLAEGEARELIRRIQDWRKRQGLLPADRVAISVAGPIAWQGMVKDFTIEIKRAGNLADLHWTIGEEVKIDLA
jgi:isoleucyl-tRNA synthetase